MALRHLEYFWGYLRYNNNVPTRNGTETVGDVLQRVIGEVTNSRNLPTQGGYLCLF